MNRNDYRRALIMLRSLKTGVSGYVRLERRTLMGTLQFTVNGAADGEEMYAVLLYGNGGGYGAIKLEKFAAPRYGQTGLVWKFDPRNIEGRTLEQYDLAAVIGISGGVCELLLSGNLNGSVEADWIQMREAACRLFSPVRISGTPISPIDERQSASSPDEGIQTLPEYNEQTPAYPQEEGIDKETACTLNLPVSCSKEETNSADESNIIGQSQPESSEPSEDECGCAHKEIDEFDRPAEAYAVEADELDVPAQDSALQTAARAALYTNAAASSPAESDELDMPAQDDFVIESTAGEQLDLNDPNAEWPQSIEPLRALFFSSEAAAPFEMEGFVFIRAPLPGDSGTAGCMVGLSCKNGFPARVCYAIPGVYATEPPAGMEGYVWRGDGTRGYWTICEDISD